MRPRYAHLPFLSSACHSCPPPCRQTEGGCRSMLLSTPSPRRYRPDHLIWCGAVYRQGARPMRCCVLTLTNHPNLRNALLASLRTHIYHYHPSLCVVLSVGAHQHDGLVRDHHAAVHRLTTPPQHTHTHTRARLLSLSLSLSLSRSLSVQVIVAALPDFDLDDTIFTTGS
jgi:hypothetical protein